MMYKKKRIALLLSALFVSNVLASGFESNVNSLHYATSVNDASYVRDLVQEEPNLASQYNEEGLTPVHVAIKRASLTSLAVLLEEKINPNIKTSSGETALIYAIKNNHPKAAELLLESGAKANIKDKTGKTAKDYARVKGAKYISLFEKKEPTNKVQSSMDTVVSSKELKSYKDSVEKRFELLESKNKQMIGDLELKILSVSSEIKELNYEIQKVKENNLNLSNDIVVFKEELEGTDLSLLDLEQKLEGLSESAALLRKEVLKIDGRTASLSNKLQKYSNAQMMQMYGDMKNQKEEDFNLIGVSKDQDLEKQEDYTEKEMSFVSFGEAKPVEIVEQEETLNLIK